MPNRLAGETSPYLQQHADNPVDWHPWNAAALALARHEDRPILLSIGYSACHWCHVMAHESFEDPSVAALMNRLFVNIKVDREERPDLDQIYQIAQQMLTGRSGGWPLTLFLTPDGTPFYGGTYFPKEPRYGLPGFADLCERIAGAWQERREEAILPQNAALRDALARLKPAAAEADVVLEARPIAAARRLLEGSFDPRYGGFGGAPKFPNPADLALLLRTHAATGDEAPRDMALTTLRRMAEGGIYDQIGGGFCRYSVDERWEIPHFEKMLYDNGPLLGLYADAWALTREPLFARVAEETAAWVRREMQAPDGGFYSSLDADSEGAEGKFYVWSREAVGELLSDAEWALAAPHWGLDGPPNFENRSWHLRVAATPPTDAAGRALLASARDKLFAARERRVRPGRDEKILTSWNALMIAGLVHAGRVFGRRPWIDAGRRALDFIRAALWQGTPRRLLATCRDGRAHLGAYLDDHAFLLAAILELLQADFRSDELALARDVAEALLSRFEDSEGGGFFFTAHDHETLIARLKTGADAAIPSGNGVAAFALNRLGLLLGEAHYIDVARRTLALFWPQLQRQAGGLASLTIALGEALQPPTTVLLRGPQEAVAAWQRQLADGYRPAAIVLALPNGRADLPAALAKPESGHVNAWVCRGVTCLEPLGDLDEIETALRAVSKVPDLG